MVNGLFADAHGVELHLVIFTVTQQNDVRVFVLDYVGTVVVHETDYRKGRECGLPLGADRQGVGYGLHGVPNVEPGCEHGGNDLRGQGGENARLDAAAESVRKDDDGTVVVFGDLDMVAAELLTVVIYAQVTDVGAEIIHLHLSSSTPSALSAQFWSRRSSRRGARRSPELSSSDFRPHGLRPRRS